MSFPALIGFAGVLVAAVATGLLAGQAARRPGTGRFVWVAGALALTVALVAQSIGFDRGFGSATFRAVQLAGLLLAPLWLAWGLAELAWPAEAARFGARLISGALAVVGSVILVTDPLAPVPFGQQWPSASSHYQSPSHYALDVVQGVAVTAAAVSFGLTVLRARKARLRRGLVLGTAAAALAVVALVLMRFSWPGRPVYPLLSLAAAALTWFGGNRLAAGPGWAGSGREPAADAPAAMLAAGHEPARAPDRVRDRNGLTRDPDRGPGRNLGSAGQWADSGREGTPPAPWPASPAAAPGVAAGPGAESPAAPPGSAAPVPPGPAGPFSPAGPFGPAGPPSPAASSSASSGLPAAPPGPPARPYGRILIFTLVEDRVAEFDRLAERLAEEVLTEPDTLVFVIHLVPSAPLQRIFYEVYRDRGAFDRHEDQSYVQRFAADRRSCVLATNVIELRLKYAKVAPLPGPPPAPQAPAPQGPDAAQAPQAQFLEPLPSHPEQDAWSGQRSYGGS